MEKYTPFVIIGVFRAYLYNSMMRNLYMNYIRDTNIRNRHLEQMNECDYEMAVLDEEIYAYLIQAIETLPEHYRQAIKLSLEGLSAEEIAVNMYTAVEAVKAYKKRGKKLLKGRSGDLSYLIFLI